MCIPTLLSRLQVVELFVGSCRATERLQRLVSAAGRSVSLDTPPVEQALVYRWRAAYRDNPNAAPKFKVGESDKKNTVLLTPAGDEETLWGAQLARHLRSTDCDVATTLLHQAAETFYYAEAAKAERRLARELEQRCRELRGRAPGRSGAIRPAASY